MPLDFQWFNRKVGAPAVTIASYGLVFSSGAIETLGNPEYVRIGFNTDKLLIGVAPVSEGDEGDDPTLFKFKVRERKGYIRINSKDFIQQVSQYVPGGLPRRGQRLMGRWVNDGNLMVLDLSQIRNEAQPG